MLGRAALLIDLAIELLEIREVGENKFSIMSTVICECSPSFVITRESSTITRYARLLCTR